MTTGMFLSIQIGCLWTAFAKDGLNIIMRLLILSFWVLTLKGVERINCLRNFNYTRITTIWDLNKYKAKLRSKNIYNNKNSFKKAELSIWDQRRWFLINKNSYHMNSSKRSFYLARRLWLPILSKIKIDRFHLKIERTL